MKPFVVFSQLRVSLDRKSTRLNSSHLVISYAVFCLLKTRLRPRHLGPPRHDCLRHHRPRAPAAPRPYRTATPVPDVPPLPVPVSLLVSGLPPRSWSALFPAISPNAV